jgi:uncharacterized membrane protein
MLAAKFRKAQNFAFVALLLSLPAPSLFAQGPVILSADGTTDTYTLLDNTLGGTAEETPDCSHPAFGPHITQATDADLGKPVFVFHIHVTPDNDRCVNFDRQRVEIKTYGPSPDYLKAFIGDTVTYDWKFKLDAGFQPSPNFTHIHQIKAGDGDADAPLITITPRFGSTTNTLQLIHSTGSSPGVNLGTLTSTPLAPFLGTWVEAHEHITFGSSAFSGVGHYSLTIKRMSDGAVLFSYSNDNIDLWRTGTTFCRPKWGIYRSLNSPSYLRDEDVRFNDYCLAKGTDECPTSNPPDFTLSASPATGTVTAGNSATYTVNVSATNGFTGAVSLSASGLPPGVTAALSPASVNGSGSSTLTVSTASSTAAGNYTLTVTGTSGGSLTHTATVTLGVTDFSLSATPSSQTINANGGTSYTATIAGANGFNGSVALSLDGLPAGATSNFSPASISGGSGPSTLAISTDCSITPGTYPLTITGTSGSLSHSAGINLVVNAAASDFALAASPSSQTVMVAGGANYTATVSAQNCFAGNVSFSVSGLPPGASAGFTPPSVTTSGSSTMSVSTDSTTPAGNYTLTITASGGGASHNSAVTLAVTDFALSQSSSSVTVVAGSCVSDTVTVTAINGFGGGVSFGISGLPTGASVTFSPSTVTGSGSSTSSICATASTVAGTYPLTLTASSGGLSHSLPLNLVVNTAPPPDFSLSASSVTLTAGSAGNSTITVSAINGFGGVVSLSVSGFPTGVSDSLSPTSVPGSGTSTLSIATLNTTPPGSYTLTVTGTSGGVTHTATVALTVNGTCTTATSGGAWQNTAIASETGTFTATFDATPSVSPFNAVVALSKGLQTGYTGFATLVRFNPSGGIDARNGGAYAPTTGIPFSAGSTYHFRLVINVPARTYSIFVTPPGGTELTLGTDFAFRSEQSTVTSLDHWGEFVNTSNPGSLTTCNFAIH